MTLNEYQEAASKTASYEGRGTMWGLAYVTIKGTGEVGEFSEKIGKQVFRAGWKPTDVPVDLPAETKNALALELGDELWYVAMKAWELGYDLSEIASMNVEKLAARKEAGGLGAAVTSDELCPQCDAVTVSAGPGGGIKCTRCTWWFCY